MIEVLGDEYYIDFDIIDEFLVINRNNRKKIKETDTTIMYNIEDDIIGKEITTREREKPMEVNIIKFELIKRFIDDLGYENETESDPMLGANNIDKMGVSFKIAFNTLTNYGILKSK